MMTSSSATPASRETRRAGAAVLAAGFCVCDRGAGAVTERGAADFVPEPSGSSVTGPNGMACFMVESVGAAAGGPPLAAMAHPTISTSADTAAVANAVRHLRGRGLRGRRGDKRRSGPRAAYPALFFGAA